MTHKLTIEQLKFARSIGATRYFKDGIWTDELTAAFFYTDNSIWSGTQWIPAKVAADNDYYPIIDFSPLDGVDHGNAESGQSEAEPDYVTQLGEECEMYTDDHG